MSETLIFLHIGKTAGTTFAEILDRNYPRRRRSEIYPGFGLTESEFADLPLAKRQALLCVKGHFDYGIHRFVPEPFSYVTFLRSPVEQVRSRFHHIRQSRWHPLHPMVRDGMSLEEFVRRSPDNYQLRTLVGFELRPGKGHPVLTREHLAQVQQNIERHFGAVGLTERFDESLLWIRRRFGLRKIDYRRRNVRRTGSVPAPTVAEREALEETTRLDRELYAWAAERLERAIDRDREGFENELRHFRESQASPGNRRTVLDALGRQATRLGRLGRTVRNRLPRRLRP